MKSHLSDSYEDVRFESRHRRRLMRGQGATHLTAFAVSPAVSRP
jgi:hypothetical protein